MIFIKKDDIKCKYTRTFKEISNPQDQIDYKELRKMMKNYYKCNGAYMSLDNIRLEKERVVNKLDQLNSQFTSIAISLLIMLFGLLIPAISEGIANTFNRNLNFLIKIIYSTFTFGYIIKHINKTSDEFRCLKICRNVLEELEIEKLNEADNEYRKISSDVKDIKSFLGI